jgi:transposase
LPTERLWVIDEFGIHLAMSRGYARAPRGERAEVVEPFNTGSNISVLSALTLNGIQIPMMVEGAIDSGALAVYVEHFLVRRLQPGDIVLWDQVPIHKNADVRAMIEATGARVDWFPAYSPDLDPIEECISKIKACLRKCKVETVAALRRALKQAFEQVTLTDIRGWFTHCGFVLT